MKIENQDFQFIDTFRNSIAIADSWVVPSNKTGHGNGEAKLYIASKESMREFYGTAGFSVKCFLLKKDLLAYMNAIKFEYMLPSQSYRKMDEMQVLWQNRIEKINTLPDFVEFTVHDQGHIKGERGYINSNDLGYKLIREIALPYISYISVMKLLDGTSTVFYWKLFADFAEIDRRRLYVINYGKKNEIIIRPSREQKDKTSKEYRSAREGQGKYREALLEECPMCPITGITEESLLIASHIKPWAVSDDKEKIDPKNGFILSPLYDKLFDRGYITFTTDRRVKITNWLSNHDKNRIGIKDNQQIPILPIDDDRIKYLKYHNEIVYKG